MSSPPSSGRRRIITGLASVLAAGFLAGCSGDGEDGGEETTTATTTTTTTTTTMTTTTTTTRQAEVVEVAPDTENVFRPANLEIPQGTTVTFVWRSSGHSLTVDSQPSGAEWEGVPETQSSGYEHSHTFEVPGTYEYYCEPHGSFGMEGTITVTEA